MRFNADTNQGPVSVVVTEVADETVTVDANHALAGQSLNFAVEVQDVRDATEEELSAGRIG
jgi:FKBP-type peptidyl-prolyl cis-trans isomerase SlyD